jgi:hypothetical protein
MQNGKTKQTPIQTNHELRIEFAAGGAERSWRCPNQSVLSFLSQSCVCQSGAAQGRRSSSAAVLACGTRLQTPRGGVSATLCDARWRAMGLVHTCTSGSKLQDH